MNFLPPNISHYSQIFVLYLIKYCVLSTFLYSLDVYVSMGCDLYCIFALNALFPQLLAFTDTNISFLRAWKSILQGYFWSTKKESSSSLFLVCPTIRKPLFITTLDSTVLLALMKKTNICKTWLFLGFFLAQFIFLESKLLLFFWISFAS